MQLAITGRVPKMKQFHVRLPQRMAERLKKLSEEIEKDQTEIIADALREYFRRLDKSK